MPCPPPGGDDDDVVVAGAVVVVEIDWLVPEDLDDGAGPPPTATPAPALVVEFDGEPASTPVLALDDFFFEPPTAPPTTAAIITTNTTMRMMMPFFVR